MAYRKHIKRGVFAALTESAATTITTANTYYPISGTFSNSPIELFELVADPAIQYNGDEPVYFEIDAHASFSVDSNSATVKAAIKKNGELVTESIMSAFAKTANELFTFSGTSVVELENGDKIQLVCTSDGDGDVITFENITATIRNFFE